MKIELRNVKISNFMSRETYCFMATVYIDGKKASVVENDGQGGPDLWHDNFAKRAVIEYCKTLPQHQFNGMSIDMNAEILINELLTEHILAQDLKKALAKRILFTRDDGKIYETKTMSRADLTRLLTDPQISKKLNATHVLNSLPFPIALELYSKV
jgi:hypothetical protein